MRIGKSSHWKVMNLALILSSCVLGCASSYSLREQHIISSIPEAYRNHNSGIIVNPTNEDIDHALNIGKSFPNDDTLLYAYIYMGPSEFWNSSQVYVKVETPLYLMAEHTREQAREYKEADTEFVTYCKNLDAVRISLIQQYVDKRLSVYPVSRKIILLRDGKRIEPLSSIKSYKRQNPFKIKADNQSQQILDKIRAMTPKQSMKMTPKQIEDLESTYRSMGYSEEQIRTYIHAIKANMQLVETSQQEGAASDAILAESDAVYSASELRKPGKYEIVFRTPPSNSLFYQGDKEVRLPISFEKFR